MRKPLIYLPLVLGAVAFNCAYFNTFYNARRDFQEAERRRETESPGARGSDASYRELYDRAIKGASKVLAFYPESRWVDDSLLLLGKAFYRKGEYGKAERKFRELLVNFPGSKLVDEAAYWRGLSLRKMGDPAGAEEVLSEVARSSRSNWRYNALLALGDMRFEGGDYAGASELYSRVSSDADRGELRGMALLALGRCYAALGKPGRAVGYFRASLKQGFSSIKLEYDARVSIGECYESQGKFTEAIEAYGSVLGRERMRPYFPRVKLMIARCYHRLGRIEDALDIYSEVAESYGGTPHAAEALYRKGLIYQRELRDISTAEELYSAAGRISGSDFADSAKAKAHDISLLKEYRSRLAEARGPERLKVQMLLAEHFFLNFEEPDSALATYSKVAEGDTSGIYAPKAMYAIGWIRENVSRDSVGAAEAYGELLKLYPDSRYAGFVREKLGIAPPRGEDAPARAEFLRAEDLRMSGRLSPEGYIALLDSLVSRYPKSRYAPKALYAIAWTYENCLDDVERAAGYYRRLLREFPGSEYAELGRRKMEYYNLDEPPAGGGPTTAIPDSTAL